MITTEHQCWQTQLSEGTPQQRAAAAENLSYLGEEAAFAAVELVQACAGDETVRDWAVAALEQISRPSVDAVAGLSALMHAADPLVSYWAVTLLGRLGPDAATQKEQLLALARNPNCDLAVREKAVWAIGQIGPPAASAVPVLRELMQSEHVRLKRLAEEAVRLVVGTSQE